ncbi:MAG: metallophosphoesterase family protein [candidate division NC10 bacterium]|nr:metallophosphoesterase family protein [candidate division NC10 bacterium]
MKRLKAERPFAVFSDVHGNLPALEAVLEDMERRKITMAICLGDLVGYGPFPNEVVALIRERGIPTLMGNYDQGIGFSTGDCGCAYRTEEQRLEGAISLKWTEEVVTAETRAFLRSLEDRFLLATPAGEMLAVHGSPRRINEYLFEDRPLSALARMVKENPYRAILFGHTHIPYVREVEGATFVNVGSAGRPKDGDWRACYSLIDPATPMKDGPLGVDFIRVPYDYERLAGVQAQTPLITRFLGPARIA